MVAAYSVSCKGSLLLPIFQAFAFVHLGKPLAKLKGVAHMNQCVVVLLIIEIAAQVRVVKHHQGGRRS